MILTPHQAQAVVACMRALGAPELAGSRVAIEFPPDVRAYETVSGKVIAFAGPNFATREVHATQTAFAKAYGLDDDGLMPF